MNDIVERYFERSGPHVVSENIDQEVVSINLNTGDYYSMRGWAAAIWLRLLAGNHIGGILEELGTRFEDVTEEMEAGVIAFIQELVAEGLIKPSSGRRREIPASSADWVIEGGFESPKLEVYADMRDFLLVDPIHEIDVTNWPPKDNATSGN